MSSRALLGIAVLCAVLLLIAQECGSRVFADGPGVGLWSEGLDGPVVIGHRHQPSLSNGYRPNAGKLVLSLGGGHGSVEYPDDFILGAWKLITECENRQLDPEKVSETGDYGLLQINIIHAPEMGRMGLDFYVEKDRWEFAYQRLYLRQAWAPWTCSRVLGMRQVVR